MRWHWSVGAAGSWARWRLVAADRCSTPPAVDRSSKCASPPSQVCPSPALLCYASTAPSWDGPLHSDRQELIGVDTTWVTRLAKKVTRGMVCFCSSMTVLVSSSPVGANCALCCRAEKNRLLSSLALMSCCIVLPSRPPCCVVVNASR